MTQRIQNEQDLAARVIRTLRDLRRIDGSTMKFSFGLTAYNCGSLRSSDAKPACPAVIHAAQNNKLVDWFREPGVTISFRVRRRRHI